MSKLYEYNTCCVHSTAPLIRSMIEQATDVTYETMKRNCVGLLDWAEEMGYARYRGSALTLKEDWHVSYHKSIYDGKPCFYLRHSAIEYIWTYWKG